MIGLPIFTTGLRISGLVTVGLSTVTIGLPIFTTGLRIPGLVTVGLSTVMIGLPIFTTVLRIPGLVTVGLPTVTIGLLTVGLITAGLATRVTGLLTTGDNDHISVPVPDPVAAGLIIGDAGVSTGGATPPTDSPFASASAACAASVPASMA